MLQVEAAALAAVAEKGLAGRLRLGIPDDYAEPFLPEIVTRFMRRHPLVEMAVICESQQRNSAERKRPARSTSRSSRTAPRIAGVEVVREEPLRWVAGPRTCVHEERPLPLALSGPTCAWRQGALAALDGADILWRWRWPRPITRASPRSSERDWP